jgi:hypothetical protein
VARASQYPARKKKDRAEQFQHAFHSDTDDTKGQQDQPHKGIKHERHESERPAQEEQKAPQQELQHDGSILAFHTQMGFRKFPLNPSPSDA